MKKKLVALLMSAVMASALLAGCGTAKDAETEQETVEDAAETETEAGSQPLKMQMQKLKAKKVMKAQMHRKEKRLY